jgi:hypothetical protein
MNKTPTVIASGLTFRGPSGFLRPKLANGFAPPPKLSPKPPPKLFPKGLFPYGPLPPEPELLMGGS